MATEIVKQVVELVYEIYSLNYDISNFEKLRELSRAAWEENHEELLKELENIEPESNVDFQLFWYDCIGFPQEMPRYFYKNGKPAWVLYGYVPSRIGECEQYCGYHDANINHAEYLNHKLTLLLDQRRWRIKSSTDYQLKLSFEDIYKIFIKDLDFEISNNQLCALLSGNQILSAHEIPMINFVFENLGLDKEFLLSDKRIFNVTVNGDENFELYIIFGKWRYEIGPGYANLE